MNPLQPLFVSIHLLWFGKFILLQEGFHPWLERENIYLNLTQDLCCVPQDSKTELNVAILWRQTEGAVHSLLIESYIFERASLSSLSPKHSVR